MGERIPPVIDFQASIQPSPFDSLPPCETKQRHDDELPSRIEYQEYQQMIKGNYDIGAVLSYSADYDEPSMHMIKYEDEDASLFVDKDQTQAKIEKVKDQPSDLRPDAPE